MTVRFFAVLLLLGVSSACSSQSTAPVEKVSYVSVKGQRSLLIRPEGDGIGVLPLENKALAPTATLLTLPGLEANFMAHASVRGVSLIPIANKRWALGWETESQQFTVLARFDEERKVLELINCDGAALRVREGQSTLLLGCQGNLYSRDSGAWLAMGLESLGDLPAGHPDLSALLSLFPSSK